jgi:hypothetical protein
VNAGGSQRALSESAVGALRTFAYFLATGAVGLPLLDGVDYWETMRAEPSLIEQTLAIFGNVLRVDDQGVVLNAKVAERRAAQYIHEYMTGQAADPPWEEWETELHGPFGDPGPF